MPTLFKLLALLLLAAPATAQAQPAAVDQSQAPLREVQVAPESFTRGAPVPVWVRRVPVPDTQRQDPLVLLLGDVQVRIGDSSEEFAEAVIRANAASALGRIGQIQVAYHPFFQKLLLHSVDILRGGERLERTASADVRFLERELGLERGIYSGAVTASILVPDVRVGDVLQLAYTLVGRNPVFGNVYFGRFAWDLPEPIERRRMSITHAVDRPVQWRMVGDYRKSVVEPRITRADGMQTVQFDERGIDALPAEPFVPENYFEYRGLQFSEYRDWNQVARWAQALFPPVVDVPDELRSLVAGFAALPDDTARAAAALRWVQREIRNFSMSLGESSHRPQSPGTVLQRRFGDCKDKTYLLLTMLRQMGIEATPMLVSQQHPRGPGHNLPMPQVFDHAVLQARLHGEPVTLDPTRPPQAVALMAEAPLPEQTLGLLASDATTALVAVGPPSRSSPVSFSIEERFALPALAPEGTLESRITFGGPRADMMRYVWGRASEDERRKISMSDYDRRYPGTNLLAEPTVIDEGELNQFTLVARYKLPRLAQRQDDEWRVSFAPASLSGMFNLPPSLQRQFPLAATDYPMTRRYKVQIDWPTQVSAMRDPSSQVLDGVLFRAESRTAFRGNRYEHHLGLTTKRADLAVDELPRLMDDLQKLNRLVVLGVNVTRLEIAVQTPPGMGSAQAAVVRRANAMVERTTAVIAERGLVGEELAQALCLRAAGQSYLGQQAAALRDSAEAVRIAPALASAWQCHAKQLYGSGDFRQADEAFTRALLLGEDEADVLFGRAMARFYAGRGDAALADFVKSAAATGDGDGRLFTQIWQIWALQRAGQAVPPELLAQARREPTGAWPRPALAMLVGDITPEAMLAELDRLHGDEREMALVEAWFYVGQHLLVQGRPVEARTAFEKCRAIGMTNYFEHIAAGFELARLGARPAGD